MNNEIIIGTGLSGLVGSRIVELLSGQYEFEDLSLETKVDILDYEQVLDRFSMSRAGTVLHMAARTDVDACEDEKILGESGLAWQTNVEGTRNIVDAAKKTGKRIIYISTDFVFNGTKNEYSEEDEPDPVNWYSITKFEGERIVASSGLSFAIARLAYPYRSRFEQKSDFVRRIIQKIREGGKIKALTDHFFTPTFIDDIAQAIHAIVQKKQVGIFHTVGSSSLTPFIATGKIMKAFGLKAEIEGVTRAEFFRDRAYRPFKLVLRNDKICGLGVKMKGFDEGLAEMKRQLASSS